MRKVFLTYNQHFQSKKKVLTLKLVFKRHT